MLTGLDPVIGPIVVHGAVATLIIHRTDLASYGWDVVKNSNTSEKTYLRDNKDPQLEAASWIQLDVAKQIFKSSNLDFDAEFAAAGKKGFEAVELPAPFAARRKNSPRSRNHTRPPGAAYAAISGCCPARRWWCAARPPRWDRPPSTSRLNSGPA